MSMVSLKFQVHVQGADSAATIESSSSFPIIVITNESQWCEAKGKLIMMDCFNGLVRSTSHHTTVMQQLVLYICPAAQPSIRSTANSCAILLANAINA
jgi:hypothetical protein